MHFNSIEKILAQLENQPGWERFREHRQLLNCWERVVSKQIAAQTRPLYIARQILYVATSSAARAQELSFQRYMLLKRLNKQLTFTLKDIRFSSSGWYQEIEPTPEQPAIFTISDRQKTKERSPIATSKQQDKSQKETKSPQDKAKEALQRWLKVAQEKSLTAPVCPKCNSPAAKEELARWNLCHHCVAQKWSTEYRVSGFSEFK